jgi:cytochrome P450
LTQASQSNRQAPGPGTLPFLFSLPQFRRDPLNGFFQSALEHGDVVRYRGLWVTHQLSNPADIQQVLQTNVANYRKGRDYQILKSSLGEGLLISEGELWQRQRKMTQPSFQSHRVGSFVRIMDEHTETLLRRWDRYAAEQRVFDVVPELMHLTLNIASQALFTTNLDSEIEVIREALEVGREYSVDRAWSLIRMPQNIPTRRNREYLQALGRFHQIVDRMIAARHHAPERIADLLTMLMEARDESGGAMSDKQLRDEVSTLLTAGHETTSLALSWACYLLARHPQVAERICAEIQFLNGRGPVYEDLFRLKYTRMVIEEIMRLYPPVWVLSRTTIDEDEIGGYRIPAGSEILIFPYITHRHPKWWTDPDKFCPERFLPENSSGRPRYAYLPFGAGPRTCVGLNFAMTEIQVVLALLLQRFRLEPASESDAVHLDPSVTLRPLPGVRVKLRRIQKDL